MKRALLITALAAALSFSAAAQSSAPVVQRLSSQYHVLSDNGKWAASESPSQEDGNLIPSGGTVFDLTTGTETVISHSGGRSGVSDITDDGSIVVGECLSKPAFWSRELNDWVTLPLPSGTATGRLNSVTPDGKYAVGYATPSDFNWGAVPVMYDLSSRSLIDLPGLPELDMTHLDQRQNCLYSISADGRYIVGSLSVSYLMPVSLCSYIYDRETATYRMIGFTENDTAPWTPQWKNLLFVETPSMSAGGKWATGSAYMVEPISGSEFGNEFRAAYKYNIASGEIEIFDGSGENDIVGSAILDDGTLLAQAPAGNPYANMYVRHGNYYISLADIFKQVYGIDFFESTGMQNTGFPVSVSTDGLTMVMITGPETSYLLRLSEPLSEAAAKVNLLNSYTVSPAAGSVMSKLREVRLTFDRDVEVNGQYSKITCKSEDGLDSWQPLQSGGWTADGKRIIITFRGRDLRKGVRYTLNIPAGLIRLKGDRGQVSPEINITFTGRGSDPVALVSSYPADEASVSAINTTTDPVILTFDADVRLSDAPSALLYRVGEDEPYVTLNVAAADRRIMLYPVAGQYLFSGTDYRLVVPAGTVSDVSGEGFNEEISLLYHGSYVRQVSSDDKNIFISDCGDYNSFMFYDGDRLAPAPVPAGWGFTANLPWNITRESTSSTDMCMAAHSMFVSGGTSDDWMVTPQLFIPDSECYLKFEAQSYLKAAVDRLKVYVYTSGNVYNTLSKTIVDDICANGDLVFDEQLSPGESQEDLADDWVTYTVPLDKYAGKDIYIAFVNRNTDASAVFVDNINVVHDLKFLASFSNSDRVVSRENIVIAGNVVIASEIERYDSISLVLRDGEGNEIDRIEESGLNLVNTSVYEFAFEKPLPLVLGDVNNYTVDITLGDDTSTIRGEVRNLTFEPSRRIVLEEFSGALCPNCPQGILAVENIGKLYPGKLLPVIVRAYQSDPLGAGVGSYAAFLGMNAAPSGRINRGDIVYPMVSNNGDYMFSGAGYKDSETGQDIVTWLDVFRNELAQPADGEISFSSAFDEASKTVSVNFDFRSALNKTNMPVNILAVITENSLETFQDNNLSNVEDPDLGEWGKGGIYASSTVYPYIIDDVARGTCGTTFAGTGGLIPAQMKAGETYSGTISFELPSSVAKAENCDITLMLIDSGTLRVLNANRCGINGSTDDEAGVSAPVAAGADGAPVIVCVDSRIVARAAEGTVTASAYSVDGRLLGSACGEAAAIDLAGYTGIVIVRASAADGAVTTSKFVIR